MARIFISHTYEDQYLASEFMDFVWLCLDGDDEIFCSSWSIRTGELWVSRILAELREAKVVIVLLSPRSVGRPWVAFETGVAWAGAKVIIPVCVGGLAPGDLPSPFADFQAVHLTASRSKTEMANILFALEGAGILLRIVPRNELLKAIKTVALVLKGVEARYRQKRRMT